MGDGADRSHPSPSGHSRFLADGPRRSPRQLLRAVPRTLWAISALWVALLFGASIIWPVGYGFDEPAHVSMAYTYSLHPFRFYAGGDLQITKAVFNFEQEETPPVWFSARLATAPIPARSARPTFAQLGGPAPAPQAPPDQMVQHPPAYYYLEAILLRLPGVSGLSAGLVIWLMRLVSIAIMAPVPLLCWDGARWLLAGASRRQPGPTRPSTDVERVALVAAALPLSIPDLIRDGASVNNDTLLILATSVVLALLARVVGGDRSLRTAAGVSIALFVALWTKGFALMLPLVILVAYLCGSRRSRPTQPSLLRPLAVVAAGCVAGSLWWIRNLVVYGTVQTNGYGPKESLVQYGRPIGGGTLGPFIKPYFGGFVSRIWSQIGFPADQPASGPVVEYGWAILVAAGILLAVMLPRGYRGRLRSWPFILAVLALVAIDFSGSFSTFRTYRVVRANQGRYVYSAIVSIAAVAAAGFARVVPVRLLRWATPTVVAAAVATNLWCWALILRDDYQPTGRLGLVHGLTEAFHGVMRWSPLPTGVTLMLVVVLPLLTTLLALFVSVRDALVPDADEQLTVDPMVGEASPALPLASR